MAIDKFSKEQFENELPLSANLVGLVKGEYVYRIDVDAWVSIDIRSSIDSSGYAADAGFDSLRAWIYNIGTGKPIAGKDIAYTTRIKGWADRFIHNENSVLKTLAIRYYRAGNCNICNQPKSIVKSKSAKNPGRIFSKCFPCDSGFEWIDDAVLSADERDWLNELFSKNSVSSADRAAGGGTLVLAAPANASGVSTEPTPESSISLDFLGDEQVELPVIKETLLPAAPDASVYIAPGGVGGRVRLNSWQQAVVDTLGKGAIVCESAPGSGKTRTTEELVAAMLISGVNPARIGAFTFSRKAASELRVRIASTVFSDLSPSELAFFEDPFGNHGDEYLEVENRREWVDADPRRAMIVDWICTIHALSYRLLKRAGYKLRVLSGKNKWEADSLIKDTIKELDWKEYPRSVEAWIGDAILNLVETYQAENYFAAKLNATGGPVWVARNMAEVYRRYMDFMHSRNLVDFNMLEARVRYLLKNDLSFKNMIINMFDYVIVDEAQDTSRGQSEILFTMAKKSGNVVFVGDVDQAMYSFRGAQPSILRDDFDINWDNVDRFNLPINYRSTKNIIDTAARLIRNNYLNGNEMYLKPFGYRDDAPDGDVVEFVSAEKFDDMSMELATIIKERGNPGDWFVLNRTRAECAAIHTTLISLGIPAINKVGGLLFGSSHIRKVLAYARLASDYQNARDDLGILKEIANVATGRFRAPMTRRNHREGCTDNGKPAWKQTCSCPIIMEEGKDFSHVRFYGEAAINAAGNWRGIVSQTYEYEKSVRTKGAKDLVEFVERLESLASDAKVCLHAIITESVLPWLAGDEGLNTDDLAENGKVEEFDVLLNLVKPNDTIDDFLGRVDELSQSGIQSDNESVIVGTFHFSKGAERPNVAVNLTRCPIIPPQQTADHLPIGGKVNIEEERRLAFVGITRAKDYCVVIAASEWNGKPMEKSRFIEEIGL